MLTTPTVWRLRCRYYCIVLQYNAKLNAEQLMRFVREQLPEGERPGRKHFNFQHAPADVRTVPGLHALSSCCGV